MPFIEKVSAAQLGAAKAFYLPGCMVECILTSHIDVVQSVKIDYDSEYIHGRSNIQGIRFALVLYHPELGWARNITMGGRVPHCAKTCDNIGGKSSKGVVL